MATELLHLSFRLMTEKTFTHSMDSSLLISDVKALIETDSEIAPENQRLIFKGQLLKDEYTLQSYGLKSGNTIHVVGRVATLPTAESATSANVDVPDNVVEPDSTDEANQQQNPNVTSGTEQTAGATADGAASATGGGRGFGLPMGIFMSPIYATISVSGPGSVPSSETAMEQVASQFFSGVVSSLLTSFNNGPGTSTNTPSAAHTSSTERSSNDELLVDLELSTTMLNRVTRSVKRLNNSPSTPVSVTSRQVNGTGNASMNNNLNTTTSGTESVDSAGEFNNLVSTTGNVDAGNFRVLSQTNSMNSGVLTIELDRRTESGGVDEGVGHPPVNNNREYEEFEGRGGKVLVIDPELLSSKLPWESLNKLEQVLFDRSNAVESDSYEFDQEFMVTEELVDVDASANTGPNDNNVSDDCMSFCDLFSNSRNPVDTPSVNGVQGQHLPMGSQGVRLEFNGNHFDNVSVDHRVQEREKEQGSRVKDADNEDNKENMDYRNEGKPDSHVEFDLSERPKVVEVTEEKDSHIYEEFMEKFHSYELRLNEIMREFSSGDRNTQLDRFKQLSSAMAIKTRIDVSLCALFSWMQTQMVSTERARAFATHMGWNTSSSTSTAQPQTGNTAETPMSEVGGDTPSSTISNNTPFNPRTTTGNTPVTTTDRTTGVTGNTASATHTVNGTTTTLPGNFTGVGQVMIDLPVTGPGVGVNVSVGGTRVTTNSGGLTHNNPFNMPSTNPFATTQSVPFTPFSSTESTPMYNNTTTGNTQPEVQQTNSATSSPGSAPSSLNQTDLFARYRSNPDFASSMARVRQTRLSDSYHSS